MEKYNTDPKTENINFRKIEQSYLRVNYQSNK